MGCGPGQVGSFTFRQKFGQTGLAMWLYSLTNRFSKRRCWDLKQSRQMLPISQLRSLEDLLEHLIQIRQAKFVKMPVNLSKWLENTFEAGWQSMEALWHTKRI